MYSLASRLYNSVFSDPTEQNSTSDKEQESDVKIETTSSNSANNPEIDVPIIVNSNIVISVNDESTTTFPMINSPQRAKSPINPSSSSSSSSSLTISKSKKLTPIEKSNKLRKKIILEPGHSPLDWAKLKSSGVDLKGVSEIRNYTLEELKKHNRRDDAWSAYNGKIYNVTSYIKFHPGGEKELMRAAGKDGTKLFMDIHSWVNYELMLNECFVGYLVGGNHNLLVR